MPIPFGPEIWIADGPAVSVAGFPFPTRMAIIRLSDGGLFIWSPIHLTEDLRTAIAPLGEVAHIAAPNHLHHLFLPEWKAAYLAAKLHAPPGLRAKRPDIAFDTDITDAPSTAWSNDIDPVLVHGNRITTEAVFFHRASGTALFTDLLQQIPPHLLTGWRKLVAKFDRMTGDEPQVPMKFRLATTNRRAARQALTRILAWPAQKVLIAHGEPVERDAQTYLRRAFSWLA
jgi:hypothetical protein